MVITQRWIASNSSYPNACNGRGSGWTRKQLDVVGVAWPPRKGWRSKLAGTVLPDDRAHEFELLGAKQRERLREIAAGQHVPPRRPNGAQDRLRRKWQPGPAVLPLYSPLLKPNGQ
jgi:hypothetical protein